MKTYDPIAAEVTHDDYICAAHVFRLRPEFRAARHVETAYRRFYIAFAGAGGLDEAIADMRTRLARQMVRTAAT
jgi:hypothetical protein